MSHCGTPRVALVVEDEWLLRDVIAEAFRGAGWHVLEASTAEEAIDFLEAGAAVDIVFTDIQLAGRLSGWDVGERCRGLWKDVPVIYASGNARDRSRKVRDSLFFDKPYEASAVMERADELCQTGRRDV